MANVKISDLTEDTSPASGDWIETEDVSANASKKVQVSSLLKTAGLVLPQSLTSGAGTSWSLQTWNPTWTNLTVGNGTLVSKYIQIGKNVYFRLGLTWGSTTSVSGSVTFTLPVTSVAILGTQGEPMGQVALYDGTNVFQGPLVHASTTTAIVRWYQTQGTGMKWSNISGTSPNTWTTGAEFNMWGQYEAA